MAIPFYLDVGFRNRDEWVEWTEARPVPGKDGLAKLDMLNPADRHLAYTTADSRVPVSDRFGVLNAKLLMYHAVYGLKDNVFHVPDLGVVVLMKREGETLTIYDIVAPKMPAFDELYAYFDAEGVEQVEFRFFTDKLRLKSVKRRVVDRAHFFTKGSVPFEPIVPPFTCQA